MNPITRYKSVKTLKLYIRVGFSSYQRVISALVLPQVVIAIMMVVSTILETTLSSGVLPRTTTTTPGTAT
jgi:hypothetical protein